MNNINLKKRHFTVVYNNLVGSQQGLYISSNPYLAAKKIVSKLCANNKNKKVELSIRETTRESNKKIYGPYIGYMKKLDKPVKFEGYIIRYKPVSKLKKKSQKMKGGTIDEELQKLVEEESFSTAEKILHESKGYYIEKPFLFITVGASPAYTFTALHTLLRIINSQHSVVEIPLSGLSLINDTYPRISSEELLESFKKYILQFIQNYINTHDFIIIDHTHTGKSANKFIQLLRQINFMNRIIYINLVDIKTHNSMIQKPHNIDGYLSIKTKSLNLISGHNIPRAVPQYFFWLNEPIDYSKISQDAINLRKRVKDYVKEKIFNKRQKNYNNYMRNQRNPHNI